MFYPLPVDQDDVRTKPNMSLLIIAINVVVFCLPWGLEQDFPGLIEALYLRGALFPAVLSQGGTPEMLLSYMFLHADLWHLLGNMAGLLAFGFRVEDALGRLGFLLFYLACGVAAGLAQVAMAPGAMIPVVGASGAVAGVMAAHLIGFWRTWLRVVFLPLWGLYLLFFPVLLFVVVWPILPLGILRVPSLLLVVLWMLSQAQLLADELSGEATSVAVGAHLGGFALGLGVFGLLRALGRARPTRERGGVDVQAVRESARALRKERES